MAPAPVIKHFNVTEEARRALGIMRPELVTESFCVGSEIAHQGDLNHLRGKG
jgi:hypothetical protein